MTLLTRRQALIIATILIAEGVSASFAFADDDSGGGFFDGWFDGDDSGSEDSDAGGRSERSYDGHEGHYGSELDGTERNAVDPNFDHLLHEWDFDKSFEENWDQDRDRSQKDWGRWDVYEAVSDVKDVTSKSANLARVMSWVLDFAEESKVLGKVAKGFEGAKFGIGTLVRISEGTPILRSFMDQIYATYDDSVAKTAIEFTSETSSRTAEWLAEHAYAPLDRNIHNWMGVSHDYFPRY